MKFKTVYDTFVNFNLTTQQPSELVQILNINLQLVRALGLKAYRTVNHLLSIFAITFI